MRQCVVRDGMKQCSWGMPLYIYMAVAQIRTTRVTMVRGRRFYGELATFTRFLARANAASARSRLSPNLPKPNAPEHVEELSLRVQHQFHAPIRPCRTIP